MKNVSVIRSEGRVGCMQVAAIDFSLLSYIRGTFIVVHLKSHCLGLSRFEPGPVAAKFDIEVVANLSESGLALEVIYDTQVCQ